MHTVLNFCRKRGFKKKIGNPLPKTNIFMEKPQKKFGSCFDEGSFTDPSLNEPASAPLSTGVSLHAQLAVDSCTSAPVQPDCARHSYLGRDTDRTQADRRHRRAQQGPYVL